MNETLLATIDLGSNVYRLEIARLAGGNIQPIASTEEVICLGSGLDEQRRLTREAMERGWACLARFAERLAGFAPHEVRAVAARDVCDARNRDHFLLRARTVLGFPIRVIPGVDAARGKA